MKSNGNKETAVLCQSFAKEIQFADGLKKIMENNTVQTAIEQKVIWRKWTQNNIKEADNWTVRRAYG